MIFVNFEHFEVVNIRKSKVEEFGDICEFMDEDIASFVLVFQDTWSTRQPGGVPRSSCEMLVFGLSFVLRKTLVASMVQELE